MEKHRYGFLLILSIIASLGLVSLVSCIVAEAKKAKKEDVKLDGKMCYLPESHAFGFGIAALTCLIVAQIIGNVVICGKVCSRENGNGSKAKKPTVANALLVLSWISFGLAVILLSTATSMNMRQPYGKGWLDQRCYLVKDGVYIGSGALALITITAILGSATLTIRRAEQGHKVHSQVA